MISVNGSNVKVIKFNGNDVKKVIQDGEYIWAKPVGTLYVNSKNYGTIPTPSTALGRIVTYEPTAPATSNGTIYYGDSFRVEGGPCSEDGYYIIPSSYSSGTTYVSDCTGDTMIDVSKYYFNPSISHTTESGTDLDRSGNSVNVTIHRITITPLPSSFSYCTSSLFNHSVVEITSLTTPTMSVELEGGEDSWYYTMTDSNGTQGAGGVGAGDQITTESGSTNLAQTITLKISIPAGSTGTGNIALKVYPAFSRSADQGCVSYSLEYFNNTTVSSTTT